MTSKPLLKYQVKFYEQKSAEGGDELVEISCYENLTHAAWSIVKYTRKDKREWLSKVEIFEGVEVKTIEYKLM
jgi:hypothetical protein